MRETLEGNAWMVTRPLVVPRCVVPAFDHLRRNTLPGSRHRALGKRRYGRGMARTFAFQGGAGLALVHIGAEMSQVLCRQRKSQTAK